MKLGTESTVKNWIAIGLMAIAAGLFVKWYLGQTASNPAVPATRSARQVSRVNPLDPTLRLDLLKDSEQTKYESKGRNIFVTQAEIPHESQPVINQKQTPPPPPQNPGPPPINVKFFGFANKPGEPRKIFLSQGEDIWVAKEGDIIDRRYRIIKINSTSVEIEDVLSNNRQSIPLTQG